MKLNEKAFAGAAGILGGAYYIVCYVIAFMVPDLYKLVAQTWFHMLDLSSVWKDVPEGLIVGLVSFVVMSWVSGWLLAWTYNRLVKK